MSRRAAYVVFAPSKYPGLVHRRLDSRFGHCWIYVPLEAAPDGHGVPTICFEGSRGLIGGDVKHVPPRAFAHDLVAKGATAVVEVDVGEDAPLSGARPARYRPMVAFTCVTVVKAVLGYGGPLVMTPLQLFRHLVRRRAARTIACADPRVRRGLAPAPALAG